MDLVTLIREIRFNHNYSLYLNHIYFLFFNSDHHQPPSHDVITASHVSKHTTRGAVNQFVNSTTDHSKLQNIPVRM